MPGDLRCCWSVGVGPLLYLGFREAEQATDLAVWDRVTLDQLSGVAFGDVEPLAQFGEGEHSHASSVRSACRHASPSPGHAACPVAEMSPGGSPCARLRAWSIACCQRMRSATTCRSRRA